MEVRTFQKDLHFLKKDKEGWQKVFKGLGLDAPKLKPKSRADDVAPIVLTQLFAQMLNKGKKEDVEMIEKLFEANGFIMKESKGESRFVRKEND